MASFLIQPFQPSGQIVTDEDEQSHDRQIVDKEEDQRFAVIKKHEMSSQEKVFSELPPEKGIYAIVCLAEVSLQSFSCARDDDHSLVVFLRFDPSS